MSRKKDCKEPTLFFKPRFFSLNLDVEIINNLNLYIYNIIIKFK